MRECIDLMVEMLKTLAQGVGVQLIASQACERARGIDVEFSGHRS
jgi:hypothetical protein